MCGIVGYIGERSAQSILLNGLRRLEYRGYDSCGGCIFLENKRALSVRKLSGKVKDLEKLLKKKPLLGKLGIFHTRWATHGPPNQINAHPHLDCHDQIALVHNGIIENYQELKTQLLKEGHKFRSDTDTEVIVHLIEKFYRNSNLEEAVRKAVKLLKGSFAIGVISQREPQYLIGARLSSPLIVGLGQRENFLASDIPAILDYTKRVVLLEENELAVLEKDKVKITDFSGRVLKREPINIEWTTEEAQKGGYKHFMLKEIFEQPQILERILAQRLRDTEVFFEELASSEGEKKISKEEFLRVKNIFIVACGTAYHAGLIGKYILEYLCRIPTLVEVSSEFRYRSPLIDKDTLIVAISQSGETADTLASVQQAKLKGAKILSICNVLGSTLTRYSDVVLYTRAGPEISVASTKAYSAQLAILYLFALYLAELRKTLSPEKINNYLEILKQIPSKQKEILADLATIKYIANRHAHFGSFLYLGRHINYPSALEGALKLKEISYIPAEGYPAGEMKHGPIALIDEYRAVVCIAVESEVYDKMVSNIQEIKSRSGRVIAVASKGDEKIKELTKEVIYTPKIDHFFSPLLIVIPLQLLAYYIAVKRNCDVDQPRNLAKSVTVE